MPHSLPTSRKRRLIREKENVGSVVTLAIGLRTARIVVISVEETAKL